MTRRKRSNWPRSSERLGQGGPRGVGERVTGSVKGKHGVRHVRGCGATRGRQVQRKMVYARAGRPAGESWIKVSAWWQPCIAATHSQPWCRHTVHYPTMPFAHHLHRLTHPKYFARWKGSKLAKRYSTSTPWSAYGLLFSRKDCARGRWAGM